MTPNRGAKKRTVAASAGKQPHPDVVSDFTIPNDSPLTLQNVEVDVTVTGHSNYAIEFELLVNVLIGTLIIYAVSELLSQYTSYTLDGNLSCAFLWAACSVLLSVYMMASITMEFFTTDVQGSMMPMILVGFTGFLIARCLIPVSY